MGTYAMPAPIVETFAPAPMMAAPLVSAPMIETFAPAPFMGAPVMETFAPTIGTVGAIGAPVIGAGYGYGAPVMETFAPTIGTVGAGYGYGAPVWKHLLRLQLEQWVRSERL